MSVKRLKGSNKKIGLCKLAISGEMSIYTAETTKHELDEVVDDYARFLIDMSDVESIDTSGLQILLALQKHISTTDKTLAFTQFSAPVNALLAQLKLTHQFPLQV